MALVKQYLDGFMERHRARFAPHDWPLGGTEEHSEFRKVWMMALIGRKATEHEADMASVRLGATPPRFRNDHLVFILEEIKKIRAESISDLPQGDKPDLAAARECEWCCGGGILAIFRPDHDGSGLRELCGPNGEIAIVRTNGHAHCDCKTGRWYRQKLRESGPELMDFFKDFEMLRDGRSRLIPFDPTVPDRTDELDGMSLRQVLEYLQGDREEIAHTRSIQADVEAGIREGNMVQEQRSLTEDRYART